MIPRQMSKLFKILIFVIAVIGAGYSGYRMGIEKGIQTQFPAKRFDSPGYVIYKWRDKNGEWHYSDQDPEKGIAKEVKHD